MLQCCVANKQIMNVRSTYMKAEVERSQMEGRSELLILERKLWIPKRFLVFSR